MKKNEFQKIMRWAKAHLGKAYKRLQAKDLKWLREMYHEYNS